MKIIGTARRQCMSCEEEENCYVIEDEGRKLILCKDCYDIEREKRFS